MENYPNNSQTRKTGKDEEVEEVSEKKVEKVIAGEAVIRKKSLGKRFAETFVGGEDARGVFSYITFDVLVPAAKDMMSDAVSQGIDRMLYGESRGPSGRSRSGSRPGYVNYNRMSSDPRGRDRDRDSRPSLSRRARANHDFNEIILPTRAEADEVIDRLFDLVSQYDTATVADLYELVGQSGNFTDEKYGWTDLRGANARRARGGWVLDLPRVEALD